MDPNINRPLLGIILHLKMGANLSLLYWSFLIIWIGCVDNTLKYIFHMSRGGWTFASYKNDHNSYSHPDLNKGVL